MGLQPPIGRRQLRGVVPHCGAFDAASINADGAFDLDTAAGRLALSRSTALIARVAAP
jgi:hypothetical protein